MGKRVRLPCVCWTALCLLAAGCRTAPPPPGGVEVPPDWAMLGPPTESPLPAADPSAERRGKVLGWVAYGALYGLLIAVAVAGAYALVDDIAHGRGPPGGGNSPYTLH